MFDLIEYTTEQMPAWDDDRRFWMAVCEDITVHWYFLLTMDEYAALYRLKYPEESMETIRDAYIHQFFSELNYRGDDEFCDLSRRDTKLTPVYDPETGTEYLASNVVEEREELFDKVKGLHEKRSMYMPSVDEMEEYFQFGFNLSNEEMEDAFTNLSECFDLRDISPEDASAGKDDPDREKEKRDNLASAVISSTVRLLETGQRLEDIVGKVRKCFPIPDESEVVQNLRKVYNNTHFPGNHGHTPLDL